MGTRSQNRIRIVNRDRSHSKPLNTVETSTPASVEEPTPPVDVSAKAQKKLLKAKINRIEKKLNEKNDLSKSLENKMGKIINNLYKKKYDVDNELYKKLIKEDAGAAGDKWLEKLENINYLEDKDL